MLEKIRYRLVYNRQNRLNRQGTALVQIEAYLNQRKSYFKTNIYLKPECWSKDGAQVINHPQSNELNAMLYEKILELQAIELFTNLKLFPFMRRGVLEQNTDFNNITESGIYTYTSLASFTNSPDNDYGILLVFNGSGYLIQEARQVVNTLIIKYRAGVVVDGNFQWTDWKQIQTT